MLSDGDRPADQTLLPPIAGLHVYDGRVGRKLDHQRASKLARARRWRHETPERVDAPFVRDELDAPGAIDELRQRPRTVRSQPAAVNLTEKEWKLLRAVRDLSEESRESFYEAVEDRADRNALEPLGGSPTPRSFVLSSVEQGFIQSWRATPEPRHAALLSMLRSGPVPREERRDPGPQAADWLEVSLCYREEVGWRCEECEVDLHLAQRFLEVHHIDGDRSNNGEANLVALCIKCHAEEVGHEPLRADPAHAEFLSLRRGPVRIRG